MQKEKSTSYQSVNPATGELLQAFELHTDQQTFDALAGADKAYRETWSPMPFKERSKYLSKAAKLLLERKEEVSRLATLEMGKRIAEIRSADSASTPLHFGTVQFEDRPEYAPLSRFMRSH